MARLTQGYYFSVIWWILTSLFCDIDSHLMDYRFSLVSVTVVKLFNCTFFVAVQRIALYGLWCRGFHYMDFGSNFRGFHYTDYGSGDFIIRTTVQRILLNTDYGSEDFVKYGLRFRGFHYMDFGSEDFIMWTAVLGISIYGLRYIFYTFVEFFLRFTPMWFLNFWLSPLVRRFSKTFLTLIARVCDDSTLLHVAENFTDYFLWPFFIGLIMKAGVSF